MENNGRISKPRNYAIDYMKFISAVFVIMWHSISHIRGEYGCAFASWFTAIVSPIYLCVHIFIIISGYLNHKQALGKYYKNRFKKIIIPFWVFSALKIIYTVIISNDFAHADSYLEMVLDAFVFGNLYWFSYCIFLILCIAPFLWMAFEKNRALSIVACFLLIGINVVRELIGWHPDWLGVFQFTTVIQYLPYFIFGIILQLYKKEIDAIRKKIPKAVILTVSIVVYIAAYYMKEFLHLPFRYLMTSAQAVAVFFFLSVLCGYCKPNKLIVKLSSYSYQFMLIDSFTRVIILIVIDKLFTVNVYWMLPQVLLSVLACYIICELASRFRITRFLVGL